MRIGNVGNARPHYYDRSPVQIVLWYGATKVPPYAGLVVLNYTVPANRHAFIEYFTTLWYRNAQFYPPGLVDISIQGLWSGVNQVNLLHTLGQDGRAFIQHREAGTVQAEMVAGDNLIAQIEDQSGGGTVIYDIAIKVIEFDA